MLVNRSFPEELTRRKVLTNLLLSQAVEQNQTGMVSQLLELNTVCGNIDFMVVEYYRHLLQLSEAVDLLLDNLDKTPDQRLSCEALKYLLEPLRQQMDHVQTGLELLN
jgi:hypothetical protein